MLSSLLYQVCFPDSFHSYCWGEQCAVYHAESGDTHVLNAVDLKVLQRINETPISAEDLEVEFEAVLDDRATQYIQTLLSDLADVGLIEIVHSEAAH